MPHLGRYPHLTRRHRGTEATGETVEELNRITGQIVNAAVQIHTRFGPGLKESFYETVLARDLSRSGLYVERQKPLSFDYEGLWFQDVCRPDLIVEKSVIVEVKAAIEIAPAYLRQVMTYLKISELRLGLLLNFGAPLMKDGIKRVINGY